jgi:hypothetical protein
MWMGLTSRTANMATLKTILFVQIIPWLVMGFLTITLMGALMGAMAYRAGSASSLSWFAWWPLMGAVLGATFAVAKDIGFIVWSRKKLRSSFRDEASRSLGQPRFVLPPPLPTTAEAPPVIAS